MDSDDTPMIDDSVVAEWLASERASVERYLESHGVQHNGVSQEPRWFVDPYVGVWAIRSLRNPDYVGWWVISGDVPTDYMACGEEYDAGDVLIAFAKRWREAAKSMAAGRQPDGFTIGNGSNLRELAPLLQSRAELLHEFGLIAKGEEREGE